MPIFGQFSLHKNLLSLYLQPTSQYTLCYFQGKKGLKTSSKHYFYHKFEKPWKKWRSRFKQAWRNSIFEIRLYVFHILTTIHRIRSINQISEFNPASSTTWLLEIKSYIIQMNNLDLQKHFFFFRPRWTRSWSRNFSVVDLAPSFY